MEELYPDIHRIARAGVSMARAAFSGRDRQDDIQYLELWPMHVVRWTRQSGRRGVLLFTLQLPGKITCYHTDDRTISTVRREIVAPSLIDTYQYHWCHFSPYTPSLFAL